MAVCKITYLDQNALINAGLKARSDAIFREKLNGAITGERLALDTPDFDWEGFLEAGEIVEDVHYRFAGELVLAILLPDVPANDRMKHLESIFETSSGLTPAIRIVDSIVGMYLRNRSLI